ncbi:MAG: hypothetical protein ABW046_02375 [Actinoplanes sp.]
MSQRISAFLRSPKGQRLVQQGQRQLAKPENQQRLRGVLAKFQGRRR